MKIIGLIVLIAGIFLWCGNVFGFFPTFPLAGYLTAIAGGWMMRSGSSNSDSSDSDSSGGDSSGSGGSGSAE
jgi:hypothetical protein